MTQQNSDQPKLDLTHKNLRCNFSQKTNFRSTYVAILHKTKFGSTYVGLYHTKQIRINLCCNFPHKTKFEKRALVCEDLFQPRLVSKFRYTYVGLLSTKKKKIRIKLYCNCPDKTKFGSTYVAIFYIKQNSN